MTALQAYKKEHFDLFAKIKSIKLPIDGTATSVCWEIGNLLGVTGPTIKNYLNGGIKDGFLGLAIYKEFRRLKMVK